MGINPPDLHEHSGPCADDDPCSAILEELESIDSKIRSYGIMLVTTEQRELAKQHDVRSFPALGVFRYHFVGPLRILVLARIVFLFETYEIFHVPSVS